MGIPYYYGNIIKQNPNLLVVNKHIRANRLFIDFNSIIHGATANVTKGGCKNVPNSEIFDEVLKHTKYVIEQSQVDELVYLAVDGVAPRAKIQQQRRRRYMTGYRNDLINKFKIANNIPICSWDSNCITPGTQFMIDLHQFLTDSIIGLNQKYNIKVILSGFDEVGEGEHKIIRYIKSFNNHKTRNVIYGMDADLIMLSLSCQNSTIFLMREKQYKVFELLDINLLRVGISNNLTMHDYIFMCFFLGNDFIPAVTFLKIHHNAINILCDIYYNVKTNKQFDNLVLCNNGLYSINAPFLLAILEVLAGEEANLLVAAENNFQNEQLRHSKQNCTPMERFIVNLENTPLNKKQIGFFEKSKHNGTSWRHEYYHELFLNHEESTIKKASYNYIDGFQWTLDYYFNIDKPIDTKYYYKYNYAPTMMDVYKYYLQGEGTQTNLQNTNDVDPLVQLLMVLPPSSKNLLPQDIKSVMTDPSRGLLHCYPAAFKISMYLKKQLWECIPILPDISESEIKQMI